MGHLTFAMFATRVMGERTCFESRWPRCTAVVGVPKEAVGDSYEMREVGTFRLEDGRLRWRSGRKGCRGRLDNALMGCLRGRAKWRAARFLSFRALECGRTTMDRHSAFTSASRGTLRAWSSAIFATRPVSYARRSYCAFGDIETASRNGSAVCRSTGRVGAGSGRALGGGRGRWWGLGGELFRTAVGCGRPRGTDGPSPRDWPPGSGPWYYDAV